MDLRGNWNYPTTVRFGAGRASELGEAVKAAGMSNPLVVTDPVVAKMPMTQAALDTLAAAGVPAKLFADVQPNPVETNVAAGVAAYKAGGHDGVVAFGGGSALDAGKLIALMHGQTRSVFDFEDVGDWWTRADASAIAPVVAVPTTAGHRFGGRTRGGGDEREDPHQEDHLPPADVAEADRSAIRS